MLNREILSRMRNRWCDRLTMNPYHSLENTVYLKVMQQQDEAIASLWAQMTPYNSGMGEDVRVELWGAYDSSRVSAFITQSFNNLLQMTLGYCSKGSKYYHDTQLCGVIIQGMQWMYQNRYHEHHEPIYDNWWDFHIGGAHQLMNILILMKTDLPQELLEAYGRAVKHFNGDPTVAVGRYGNCIKMDHANLLDKLLVTVLTGILYEEEADMVLARQLISEQLCYVTQGNGFYEDGSYVDHGGVPYAGGYGTVLIEALSKLLFLLEDTPWEVEHDALMHSCDWVKYAFAPLFYKGALMDMVSGRGVSRYYSSEQVRGRNLLIAILELSEVVPTVQRHELRAFVKRQIASDVTWPDAYGGLSVATSELLKELMAEDTSSSESGYNFSRVYGGMDRLVHHRKGWALGISMFSTRISAFETGNKENLKPWHQSDGMMYVYTGKQSPFIGSFWPTVDAMRLPGTTTDHSLRTVAEWHSYHSHLDWVGGVSLNDTYTGCGMAFEMEQGMSHLTGKKSWFCFDEEVVCLGTDISSSDSEEVETIVENCLLPERHQVSLQINGKYVTRDCKRDKLERVTWAHLSKDLSDHTTGMGYYFPNEMPLTYQREERQGSWHDIRQEIRLQSPKDRLRSEYISLAIPHGKRPCKAAYSYVLLPNQTAEWVAEYSLVPQIKVLANTPKIQAVGHKTLGLLGINFWEAGKVEGIEAVQPCAILCTVGKHAWTLSIADPTHLQEKIEIIIDEPYELINAPVEVVASIKGSKTHLSIATVGARGKSFEMHLAKKPYIEK